MPLLGGLQAGLQLRKIAPDAKLIFLTVIEDPDIALEAMHSGASAYTLKKCAASELFQAIEAALKGNFYVSPEIARGMQEAFIRDPEHKDRAKVLTERQQEVLQLLAEGRSMKEAADILKITPRTVAYPVCTVTPKSAEKPTRDETLKFVCVTCEILPVAIRVTISRTSNPLTMYRVQPLVCEDEHFGAAVILRGGKSLIHEADCRGFSEFGDPGLRFVIRQPRTASALLDGGVAGSQGQRSASPVPKPSQLTVPHSKSPSKVAAAQRGREKEHIFRGTVEKIDASC
jgi:FixJ family two-component response regulator